MKTIKQLTGASAYRTKFFRLRINSLVKYSNKCILIKAFEFFFYVGIVYIKYIKKNIFEYVF